MISVAHFGLIKPGDWRWPHFAPKELACRGDGSLTMDEFFLDRLEKLRDQVGFGLPITSGWRTPAYNASVSDTGDDGPHTTGKAVDISVIGAQARIVIGAAIALGFTGVGIRQHGDIAKRIIHLDTMPPAPSSPRPWVWTYNAS